MKRLLLLLSVLAFFAQASQAQVASDTLSGHDIIVLRTGKMIRAKVIEIGLDVIKYKRAGYFNGPTYTIARTDVYAINYPDSRSDYLMIADSTGLFGVQKPQPPVKKKKKFDFAKNGRASLGLGFIKAFSKGDDALDNVSRQGILPAFHLRYSFEQSEGLRFGLELATASYKFEGDSFDSYDEVVVDGTVEESVFSMSAFAQYELQGSKIRPYAIGGLGINISSVDTQLTVAPVTTEAGYLLTSGTRSTQLGVLLRGGVLYGITDQLDAYFDIGTGVSLMQVGVVFNISGSSNTSIQE